MLRTILKNKKVLFELRDAYFDNQFRNRSLKISLLYKNEVNDVIDRDKFQVMRGIS